MWWGRSGRKSELGGGRWPGSGGCARRPVAAAGAPDSGGLAVQFAQHLVEGGLAFEADAGGLGQPDAAV